MNKQSLKTHLPPILLYLVIVLTIATFISQPGQLFLLDMVMGHKIDLSDYTVSGFSPHFPITYFQYLLNYILPIDLVQKVLLTGVLLAIPSAMYVFCTRYLTRWWAFAAGLIYLLNPYVFERFAAGQWLVLLGYAYFSVIFWQTITTLNQPTTKNLTALCITYALFPIVSIHWWYIGSFVLVIYSLCFMVYQRRQLSLKIATCLATATIFIGSFILINSFWLTSFFTNNRTIAGITVNDLAAFPTTSDPSYGIIFNIMSLYGFWSNEYILPKDLSPVWLWWLATLLTIALSIIGGIVLYRYYDHHHHHYKALALTLCLIALPTIIIALGESHPLTKPISTWLSQYFPGYKGLRDTAKVIGLIAFIYALLVPLGSKHLATFLARHFELPYRAALIGTVVLALSLPLVNYPTMVNAFNSQLQAASYPSSWYQADRLLIKQQATKVLILPWHGYLSFPFSRNHIIANPGRVFFTPPVQTSTYLDNANLDDFTPTYDRLVLSWLVDPQLFEQDLVQLKRDHISHIILFKTADYTQYDFLKHSMGITPIFDSDEIALYKIK